MKQVLIKPHITEVSMKDAGKGVFTFLVLPSATKIEVKEAVGKMFNVDVTGVSTVSISRSKVLNTKFGRKKTERDIKKARVTLKKGQTIPAFEIKEEKEEKPKAEKKTEKKEMKEKKAKKEVKETKGK
ncbi:MAG: 50S ribosomal protein L23 [Candidatus Levyibacteriota bacterium]